MPEEMHISIPKKLADFIDKLTKEGYFKSREDFARCSLEIMAELYGLSTTAKGGKSLLDILRDNEHVPTKTATATTTRSGQAKTLREPSQTSSKKPVVAGGELSPVEYDILDLFSGATFEFEDALHARYTMELMKQAKPPLPKEEFIKALEKLASKKKIERTEHKGKTIWKVIDPY
ncbi:MAG: ribbon-helix-helix domain-containing protein [Candidatus Heimdallarchaeota archaeon]